MSVLKQGLVQLYTGDGKGKTSAALGLALRAMGQGFRVCVVQFMKAIDAPSGEVKMAGKLAPNLEIVRFGDSTIWGGLAPKRDLGEEASDLSSLALQYASEQIFSGRWEVVVLDEVCVAVSRGLLDEIELLHLIGDKPREVELVLTGRGASTELVEACDLVTEMLEVKHPSAEGVGARCGIEY